MTQRVILMNEGSDPLHVVSVHRGEDGRFMHDKADEPTVMVPAFSLALAVDQSLRVVISAGDRGERRRVKRREDDAEVAPAQLVPAAPEAAPAVQPLNPDEEAQMERLMAREPRSEAEEKELNELMERHDALPLPVPETVQRPADLGGPRKVMLINPDGAVLRVSTLARGPDGRFNRDDLLAPVWSATFLEIDIPEGGEVIIDEAAPVVAPQPISQPTL